MEFSQIIGIIIIGKFNFINLPLNIDKKTTIKFINNRNTICLEYFIFKFFVPPEA